jgi:hypothetical protein
VPERQFRPERGKPLTFQGEHITLPEGEFLKRVNLDPAESLLDRVRRIKGREEAIARQSPQLTAASKHLLGDEVFVPPRTPGARAAGVGAAIGSVTDPIALGAAAGTRALGGTEEQAAVAETVAGLLTPSPGDISRTVGKGLGKDAASTVARAVDDDIAKAARSITKTNKEALENIQRQAKTQPRTAKELRGITEGTAKKRNLTVTDEGGGFLTVEDAAGGQIQIFEDPTTGAVHLINIGEGVKGEGAPELLEFLGEVAKQDVTVTRGTTNLSREGLESIQKQVDKGRLILDESGGFVTMDPSPFGSQIPTGVRAVDTGSREAASQFGEDLIEAIQLEPEGFSRGGTVSTDVAERIRQIQAETVTPDTTLVVEEARPQLELTKREPLTPLTDDIDTFEELIDMIIGAFE